LIRRGPIRKRGKRAGHFLPPSLGGNEVWERKGKRKRKRKKRTSRLALRHDGREKGGEQYRTENHTLREGIQRIKGAGKKRGFPSAHEEKGGLGRREGETGEGGSGKEDLRYVRRSIGRKRKNPKEGARENMVVVITIWYRGKGKKGK